MKKLFILIVVVQCLLLMGCNGDNKPNRSITLNFDDKEYNLLGLKLRDSYEKVIQTLGEPKEKSYEVIGTFKITDQRLYTYMYYEDMIVTTQKFFDTDKYKSQEGVIEIDVSGDEYSTPKGVRVGDSVDAVTKAYAINNVFKYEKDSNDNIVRVLYNRVNGLEVYKKRDFFYDYGEIDKIAYILYAERDEEHFYPPALIFLFNNDKVTHIILFNALES
jgi:hypothetical protein